MLRPGLIAGNEASTKVRISAKRGSHAARHKLMPTMTDTAECEKSPKRRRIDGEKYTTDPNAKGDELKGAGSPGLPHLPPDLHVCTVYIYIYKSSYACLV